MSFSTTFERAVPWLALLSVLALFWLVASVMTADQPNPQPDQHAAAHSPTDEGPAVAPHNAEERIADYTYVLMWFTGVLAVATIGLILATHYLGERADRGLRTLERPYVGVHILTNNLKDAIAHTAPIAPWPHVDFIIVNRGKTPAFIVNSMAWLEVDNGEPVSMVRDTGGDDLMLEGVVLGADDRTRPNHRANVTSDWGHAGQFNVTRGVWKLIFRGYVAYRDVWGKGYVERWRADYNVTRERFGWWRAEEPLKEDA